MATLLDEDRKLCGSCRLPVSVSLDGIAERFKFFTTDERHRRKTRRRTGYEQKYGNFTVFVDLEMAARYWGEEKESEAIYAIYLRKVRYRAPNVLAGVTHFRHFDQEKRDGNSGHGSVSDHLQWETVKERVVKAASLKLLVQCLVHDESSTTNAGEVDTRHFNVFFATYRAFAKPFDVLRLILVELYAILNNTDSESGAKERRETLLASWRNILLCWLELYPDDFRDPPKYQCLTQLIEFSRNYQTALQDVFVQAIRRRDKFCRDLGGTKRHPSLDKCSLLSPLEGFDYLFSVRPSKSSDISHVDPVYVAEQLTYWDAELFKRLIPHQCQSCFWSRRNKEPNSSESVYTVKATIDQFNAVSRRVMASVVSQPNVKSSYRARVIAKWIDIAQELRILKNFSSLKAVLSGLQSEPVYRLKNVWALVSSDKVKEFDELSRIFSEDDNYNGARSILEKEGTAKAAIGVLQEQTGNKEKHQRRMYRHRRTKSEMGEIQGTVPYLGTFLTDLTMIDAAYPDNTEDGLINFEKRRREFDVIAQLRLFQSSARNYHFNTDPKFRAWFIHMANLSEQHCYQLSCLIEPPAYPTGQSNMKTKPKPLAGTITKFFFRDSKDGSNGGDQDDGSYYFYGGMAPTLPPPPPPGVAQSGNSVFYEPAQFSANALWNQWFQGPGMRRRVPPGALDDQFVTGNGALPNGYNGEMQENGSNSKCSSLETPSGHSSHNNSSSSATDIYGNYASVFALAVAAATPPATPISKVSKALTVETPEFYVVRVALERCLQSDITMTTMYKCVKLENSDRTYHLINKVLEKHQIEGEPSDYWIVQLLPDGDELVLPEKGNAFYAVSPCMEMNFELRRKTSQTPTTLRIKKKKRKKSRERRSGGNLLRWSSGFL